MEIRLTNPIKSTHLEARLSSLIRMTEDLIKREMLTRSTLKVEL
jgi:hypothetical protein